MHGEGLPENVLFCLKWHVSVVKVVKHEKIWGLHYVSATLKSVGLDSSVIHARDRYIVADVFVTPN